MTVNFEIKGMLARLLATEDLVVEHKKVDTACFNVHTRVLTLPLWEKASNVVYDMLVAHEVSHALYTPDEDMTSLGVPHQFVNIVEDARVEKLIKRRYMGLSKTFYGGYKELQEQDFFYLEGEDVFTMNLADRVNLYFKVGNFIQIQFNQFEREIVDEIANIETFDDTIAAAKKLYEYCKHEQEREESKLPENNTQEQNNSGKNSEPDQQTEMFNDEEQEEQENQTNNNQSQEDSSSENLTNQSPQMVETPSPIGGEKEEPKVKTVDALQESIGSLINGSGYDNCYVEIPLLNPETVIVNNKLIHSHIENFYQEQQTFRDEEIEKYTHITQRNIFEECDSSYKKFKKSAQKEVNYLVKEFECKKAADSYARATTARTGILNCSKLHTYKFNDDIFRKVTTLSDGKNHGLIFVLDWSGSMSNVMLDTIKQLYNLIWFCKKVSIPFEVYAFTGDWMRVSYDLDGKPIYPQPHYQKKSGVFLVDERFNLLNFLTSTVNGKTLEEQMVNLWRVASSFRGHTGLSYPPRLALSGTPLNESMIALHSVIPHFQKTNKVQKVQCVVLTDGEAAHLHYHLEIKRNVDSEPYIGTRRISPSTTFIRDRKLGTTYKIGYEPHQFTDALLKNLRDRFSDVNFIGMRIMDTRDVGSFIRRYCGYHGNEHDKAMSNWKKNKSFTITNSGYCGYFGMSSTTLSQESEFEVSEDATKTQIKSAFAKSLKTKKLNKKILGEFVELIA